MRGHLPLLGLHPCSAPGGVLSFVSPWVWKWQCEEKVKLGWAAPARTFIIYSSESCCCRWMVPHDNLAVPLPVLGQHWHPQLSQIQTTPGILPYITKEDFPFYLSPTLWKPSYMCLWWFVTVRVVLKFRATRTVYYQWLHMVLLHFSLIPVEPRIK